MLKRKSTKFVSRFNSGVERVKSRIAQDNQKKKNYSIDPFSWLLNFYQVDLGIFVEEKCQL